MKTIYLADDDEDDRMLLREALVEVIKDVRIIEVNDGSVLVDLLTKDTSLQDPTIVLMDMNMPRVNGLEALKLIKKEPGYQHIPILMMSTTSSEDLVNRAYEEGINAYIVKPITMDEFHRLAQAIDVCFLHSSHATAEQGEQPDLQDTSVVVIEDNNDHKMFIRMALQRSIPGARIIELSNKDEVSDFFGGEFLTMSSKPHLVLLDLYFPTRDKGLELLKSLRSTLQERDLLSVPLIVFSYSDDPADVKDSYKHSANAYMIKGNNAAKWESDFREMHYFWWNTVSLPQRSMVPKEG